MTNTNKKQIKDGQIRSSSATTSCPLTADHLTTEMLFKAEIRKRAFEIYCDRGHAEGFDKEDWLHAEREINARHGRRF